MINNNNLTHSLTHRLSIISLLPFDFCCSPFGGTKSGGERSSNILLALMTVRVLLMALEEHGFRQDEVTDEEVSKGLKRTIYYSDQTRRKGVGIYREKIFEFNFLVLKYILKLVKEKNFAICSLRKNPIGRVTQLFRKRESRKF